MSGPVGRPDDRATDGREPGDERIRSMLDRRSRGSGGAAGARGAGLRLANRARDVALAEPRARTTRVVRLGRGEDAAGRAGAGRGLRAARSLVGLAAAFALVVVLGTLIALGPGRAGPAAGSASPGGSEVPPATGEVVPPALAGWGAITWRATGSREVVFGEGTAAYVVDAVAWANGVVAIGYDIARPAIVARVWRSTDGRDWHEVTTGGPPFDHTSLDRVFALGDRLVAVGRDRSAEIAGAVDDPGRPVAYESADGDRWTPVDAGPDRPSPWLQPSVTDAVSGAGMTIALTYGAGGAPTLWRSLDGVEWTAGPVRAAMPQTEAAAVAWTGSAFLVGGTAGAPPAEVGRPWGMAVVWASHDGVTWTRSDLEEKQRVSAFAVGEHGVVAKLDPTGGGGIRLETTLWVSTGGGAWHPVLLPNERLQLRGDGRRIVAFDHEADGRLRVQTTDDGSTWWTVDVRGLGRWDAADSMTLDGWGFPGDLSMIVLLPDGAWGLTTQQSVRETDSNETRVEVRWFGGVGAAPGSQAFPARPNSGDGDVPCPAGMECG